MLNTPKSLASALPTPFIEDGSIKRKNLLKDLEAVEEEEAAEGETNSVNQQKELIVTDM